MLAKKYTFYVDDGFVCRDFKQSLNSNYNISITNLDSIYIPRPQVCFAYPVRVKTSLG